MNTTQAEMIRDIALHIRGVPVCSPNTAFRLDMEPVCFFGEAILAGIIPKDERVKYAYEVESSGFAVSSEDYRALLNCTNAEPNSRGNVTGQDYYDAAKIFLTKYGYGEMLK